MDITSIISQGFSLIQSIGGGILTLLGKGKLDETEIAKAREETARMLATIELQKAQLDVWLQQSYIEKTGDAAWRKWSILATMATLNAVVLNNALAATYIARAVVVPWDIVGFLVGLLVFLVLGDTGILRNVLSKLGSSNQGEGVKK